MDAQPDARRPPPWVIAVVAAAVLAGAVVYAVSRDDAEHDKSDPVEDESGRTTGGAPGLGDHWHAAYGIFQCDRFLPPLPDNGRDPLGIHSHGDGIVHIHPFTRSATGAGATLGVFEQTAGLTFDKKELRVDGRTLRAGRDTCGGEDAVVKVYVDGRPFHGDPSTIRLANRQMIVIAFVAERTSVPTTPPSARALDNLSDMPPPR